MQLDSCSTIYALSCLTHDIQNIRIFIIQYSVLSFCLTFQTKSGSYMSNIVKVDCSSRATRTFIQLQTIMSILSFEFRFLGYYLSFDPYAYLGLLYGDFSIIVSPVISANSQDRCLIFWACMYGLYVDYLNVYIRDWGTTRTYDPQFFVYGDQGQIWIQQNMPIPASDKPFQVFKSLNVKF